MPSITEAPYEPLGSNLSKRTDRAKFLLLIEGLAPDVLVKLAGVPFEKFKQSFLAQSICGDEFQLVLDQTLRETLNEWAREFNLIVEPHTTSDYNWVHHAAIGTMWTWLIAQTEEERARVGKRWCNFHFISPTKPLPECLQRFEFVYDNPWHPTDAPFNRKETEEKMRAKFETDLQNYLINFDAYYENLANDPQTQGLKATTSRLDDRHLRWVVRNRCLGQSAEKIEEIEWDSGMREKPRDSASISTQIQKIEKVLGLKSLKKRGGNQRKPKKRKGYFK